MAGAPKGNKNAANALVWKAAIHRALEKRSRLSRKIALDDLAERLLTMCDEGEISALRELGDRLDGKAVQMIVGDAERPIAIIAHADTSL